MEEKEAIEALRKGMMELLTGINLKIIEALTQHEKDRNELSKIQKEALNIQWPPNKKAELLRTIIEVSKEIPSLSNRINDFINGYNSIDKKYIDKENIDTLKTFLTNNYLPFLQSMEEFNIKVSGISTMLKQSPRVCRLCKGEGTVPCDGCYGSGVCQICKGKGKFRSLIATTEDGEGIMGNQPCPACHGSTFCPS